MVVRIVRVADPGRDQRAPMRQDALRDGHPLRRRHDVAQVDPVPVAVVAVCLLVPNPVTPGMIGASTEGRPS